MSTFSFTMHKRTRAILRMYLREFVVCAYFFEFRFKFFALFHERIHLLAVACTPNTHEYSHLTASLALSLLSDVHSPDFQ